MRAEGLEAEKKLLTSAEQRASAEATDASRDKFRLAVGAGGGARGGHCCCPRVACLANRSTPPTHACRATPPALQAELEAARKVAAAREEELVKEVARLKEEVGALGGLAQCGWEGLQEWCGWGGGQSGAT